MIIRSIEIKNFRCFKNRIFDFRDPRMQMPGYVNDVEEKGSSSTVFIGEENKTGKTSILDLIDIIFNSKKIDEPLSATINFVSQGKDYSFTRTENTTDLKSTFVCGKVATSPSDSINYFRSLPDDKKKIFEEKMLLAAQEFERDIFASNFEKSSSSEKALFSLLIDCERLFQADPKNVVLLEQEDLNTDHRMNFIFFFCLKRLYPETQFFITSHSTYNRTYSWCTIDLDK